MAQSSRYTRRLEIFIANVNNWYGTPPTFSMDPAHERITLITAPSGFIRKLIDNEALLYLKPEGLVVEFPHTVEYNSES